MKIRVAHIAMLSVLLTGATQALAAEGYWSNSAGEVWRNSPGECWHTNFWSSDMAIVGCDGKTAEAPAPVAEPAPEPAPVPVAMPAASADGAVNFGFDRADLDADAKAAIDTLVQNAQSQGTIKAVRLTGHADRIGTEDYNMDLSLRRATSVSNYLSSSAGIEPQAMEIGGRGEAEPLVGCEGKRGGEAIRCLAPNRRVDVILELMAR
ncbi:MAG: OmpA family protein [Gammaproteobacteria bacterium]|nr:OmpA family protein [Gammaproteobacteria bacterium]